MIKLNKFSEGVLWGFIFGMGLSPFLLLAAIKINPHFLEIPEAIIIINYLTLCIAFVLSPVIVFTYKFIKSKIKKKNEKVREE